MGGELEYEACAKGCLIQSGADMCMTSAANWSCTGSYGTKKVTDGDYYATNFGCYTENGVDHDDPYDNCIPACLSKAQQSGLCAGLSGPDCENSGHWRAADAQEGGVGGAGVGPGVRDGEDGGGAGGRPQRPRREVPLR